MHSKTLSGTRGLSVTFKRNFNYNENNYQNRGKYKFKTISLAALLGTSAGLAYWVNQVHYAGKFKFDLNLKLNWSLRA